jgi:N4-gp56 family major capsid protein
MGAGISASTNITELIPEITLQADFIYQDMAIGPRLVRVADRNNLPGLTIEFPRWTEVTGSTGVAETGTPTSHQMDISMPTLTMARRSVYVILGDVAKKASAQEVVSSIGEAMGMAKAKQDDAAIFGIVTATTNWTTGTGATNAALSISHILDGILLLEKNEVDDILYGVVHPHQYDNIRDELTPVASTTISGVEQANQILRDAFVSAMFGAQWFKTNRIGSGTVTATANVYNGLLFARRGIGYAWSWLESPSIEVDRDAPGAQSGLVMNYIDTAGVVYDSAVSKLYSTSG